MITECAVNFTKTQNTKGYTSQRRQHLGHANKSKLIHSDCTMLHAISLIVHLTSKKWMNHVSILTKEDNLAVLLRVYTTICCEDFREVHLEKDAQM